VINRLKGVEMIWRNDIPECEHLAIADKDDLVCTHCGEILQTRQEASYAPFDVIVDDQEKGM